MNSRTVVLSQVGLERDRQDAKWGVQPLPSWSPNAMLVALADQCTQIKALVDRSMLEKRNCHGLVLLEEFAEALVEANAYDNALIVDDGMGASLAQSRLRKELVQCAAVCVKWIEQLDAGMAGRRLP